VNGWHDLGGLQCVGPVPRSGDGDEVFHAQWEGRVFGLSLALPAQGVYNLNEFRRAREHLSADDLLLGPYYGRWLGAIERLLEEKGVLSRREIAAGEPPDGAALPPEGGQADLAERLMALVHSGASSSRPADGPPGFAIGETVRARNIHPRGHTRLPRYVRGHLGEVMAHRGCMVLPDASAHGRDDVAEHLYTVRFAARELWGATPSPRDAVCLDLWESYLEPASP
jgi:nitrile hydratase